MKRCVVAIDVSMMSARCVMFLIRLSDVTLLGCSPLSLFKTLWFIPPVFSWRWRKRGGRVQSDRWVWQHQRRSGQPALLTAAQICLKTAWKVCTNNCLSLQAWGGEAAATPAGEARRLGDAVRTCVLMNSALPLLNEMTRNFITDVTTTGAGQGSVISSWEVVKLAGSLFVSLWVSVNFGFEAGHSKLSNVTAELMLTNENRKLYFQLFKPFGCYR